MHSQSVEIMDENVTLYSGAVHPTRTVDWLPRYNWITISSKTENDERILKVKIYPRCLTADRNSFAILEGKAPKDITMKQIKEERLPK